MLIINNVYHLNKLNWLLLSMAMLSPSIHAEALSDALFKKNIEIQLKTQQWHDLEQTLKSYQQESHHVDPILLLYAQGALARHHKKYADALAAYRKILALDPTLHYVRFDLALMLIENKQSLEAEQQLRQLNSAPLEQGFQSVIESIIHKINKDKKWNLSANLQYLYNSNINNASDIRVFKAFCSESVDCVDFYKSTEYLPIADHGINYSATLEKKQNIFSNHYVNMSISSFGTTYLDEKKYNEVSTQASVGYAYKTIQQDFSLSPFYQYTWLEHDSYLSHLGISAQYKYWINPQWLTAIQQIYTEKNYDEQHLSEIYDGAQHKSSLNLTYLHSPSLLFFLGVEYQRDQLNDQSESSSKIKTMAGMYYELPYRLNTKINLSYAEKSFNQPSFMSHVVGLNKARFDHEYQLDLSLWHRDLQYQGIFPKLNISYQKNDSNLDMFYSRKSTQFFISLEKQLW